MKGKGNKREVDDSILHPPVLSQSRFEGERVGVSFPQKRESREVNVLQLLEVPGCPPARA